jgi:asparagine synthase (glutamine-hydrolysing)
MLTGVGGDSWLTGSVARLPAMLRGGHLVDAWRFSREALGPQGLEDFLLPMLRRIAAASSPRFVKRVFRAIRPARPWPSWLRDDFATRVGLAARLGALPARVPRTADAVVRDSLTRLLSAEGPLLREGMFRSADDAGMEVRHPFYDRRLVEFALALPDDLRFRNGQTRYILRQAMGPRLPPAIGARRDKGDGTLLVSQALMRVLCGTPLKNLCVADAGWVKGDEIRTACAEFAVPRASPPEPRPHHFNLWTVVAVEMWLRALDAGTA